MKNKKMKENEIEKKMIINENRKERGQWRRAKNARI